jgi:hypothetical protein
MPIGCAANALRAADAANGYPARGFGCPYINSSAGSDSDRRASSNRYVRAHHYADPVSDAVDHDRRK